MTAPEKDDPRLLSDRFCSCDDSFDSHCLAHGPREVLLSALAARIEREADLIATATHAGAEAYELREQLARWWPILEAMAQEPCRETGWVSGNDEATMSCHRCWPDLARAELAKLEPIPPKDPSPRTQP